MFVELTEVLYRDSTRSFRKRVVNMDKCGIFHEEDYGTDVGSTLYFENAVSMDVVEKPRKILAMLYGADHVRRLSLPIKDDVPES